MRNYNEQGPSDREGLSVDEACHVAGIGKTTLYELLRSDAMPARKLGRRSIILRSDLLVWMSTLPRFEPEVD